MSDGIRCFVVVDLQSGDVCLDYKTEKTDRRNFAQEASAKVTAMAKKQKLVTEQTRMGMIFAETDDELAYLIFVAPDYPERVAKQLVDKHARAVESMAEDETFVSTAGAGQSGGAKKAYAAVCKTLATEYEGGDKVSQVMREVDKVKGVMSENINQAMANLESTEALNEKTGEDEARAQSNMFNKQATGAKGGVRNSVARKFKYMMDEFRSKEYQETDETSEEDQRIKKIMALITRLEAEEKAGS